MLFMTTIGYIISNNWQEPVAQQPQHAWKNFKLGNHALASLQLENMWYNHKFLNPQLQMMLLLSSCQRVGGYWDAADFYQRFLPALEKEPYAHIVCTQMLLAMAVSAKRDKLSEHLNVNLLTAAIESFAKASEKKTWPYLITQAELQLRSEKIDDAIETLESLEKNEKLLQSNKFHLLSEEALPFATRLLLAKAYLLKMKQLKNKGESFSEIKDKFNILINELEKHAATQFNRPFPPLAVLKCEFFIISGDNDSDNLATLTNLTAKALQIPRAAHVRYDSNEITDPKSLRQNPYLRDYLLDDMTHQRMQGIAKLTKGMQLLLNKEDELQKMLQKLSPESQHKSREFKAYKKLQEINQALRTNLHGLLNNDEHAAKKFIEALDLTQSKKEGNPLVTTDYKYILKNIGLAIALLGFGYLIAGAVNQYKTGKFLFFKKIEANELLNEVKATSENNFFQK